MRWLKAVAASLLEDPAEAEDMAQTTLMAALSSRTGPREALRPWLRGVLRNVVKMEARTESRRRRRERLTDVATATDSLDQSYDVRETQRLLARAVEALAEPFRSTVHLHFFEGLRAVDIARRQGVPATTVRSRLKIALDRLRADLDRSFGAQGRDWRRALLPLAWLSPKRGPAAVSKLLAAWVAGATLVLTGAATFWALSSSRLRGARLVERPTANASPAVVPPRPAPRWTGASPTESSGMAPADLIPTPAALQTVTEATPAGVITPEHPRLIVTEARLRALRASLHQPEAPAGQALRLFTARVERDEPALLGDARLNYARAHLAQGAAFLYLITGQRRFAQQAYAQLERLYADPGLEPVPHATPAHPLGMATSGVAVALAYDWAFTGWDPSQRAAIGAQLRRALAAWQSYRHPKIDGFAGSYLAGAARAAELIEILALALEDERAARAGWLKQQLATHLREGYGAAGLGQGGIQHAAVAASSVIPALLALRGLGDGTLEPAIAEAGLWKLPLFAVSSSPDLQLRDHVRQLPSRLSPTHDAQAGWASLLLALVPEDQVPAYRHFYDRTWGAASALPVARRFEHAGVGQLWAALLYPHATPPRDPRLVLGRAVGDQGQGVFLFRSGWQGPDDVLVSLAGDFRSRPGGWDTAEAFRLSVLAGGTLFAGGPDAESSYQALRAPGVLEGSERIQAPYREEALASTLLIDGREFASRGGVGAPGEFQATPSGGTVVVHGGSKYGRLGVTASRHALVDFDVADGPAVIATMDLVRANSAREVTYQLVPGDLRGVDGIRLSIQQDAPVPTFTMRAPDGRYLRGLVQASGPVRLAGGDRLRVSTRGTDVALWVTLLVGRGEPPAVTVTEGGGLRSIPLRRGVLRWDPARNRFVVAPSPLAAR